MVSVCTMLAFYVEDACNVVTMSSEVIAARDCRAWRCNVAIFGILSSLCSHRRPTAIESQRSSSAKTRLGGDQKRRATSGETRIFSPGELYSGSVADFLACLEQKYFYKSQARVYATRIDRSRSLQLVLSLLASRELSSSSARVRFFVRKYTDHLFFTRRYRDAQSRRWATKCYDSRASGKNSRGGEGRRRIERKSARERSKAEARRSSVGYYLVNGESLCHGLLKKPTPPPLPRHARVL